MSRNSKKVLYVVIAGAVIAVAAIGCANGVPLVREGLTDPGQLLFNGYTKPDVKCYKCHNGDGTGTKRGSPLTKVVPPLPDAALLKAIEKGGKWMPPFEEQTTAEERQQLVTWLRATFGGPTGAETQEVEAEELPGEEPPAAEAPAEEAPAAEAPAEEAE